MVIVPLLRLNDHISWRLKKVSMLTFGLWPLTLAILTASLTSPSLYLAGRQGGLNITWKLYLRQVSFVMLSNNCNCRSEDQLGLQNVKLAVLTPV